MTQGLRLRRRWGLALLALSAMGVHAEVVTDGTVGVARDIAAVANRYTVPQELGARAGNNLFHSFTTLNVEAGRSLAFTGDDGIRAVIARVTGGSASHIDGRLRCRIPGADLYLLNPSGVEIGPTATLDLRGGFYLSTADELRFADGRVFTSVPVAGSTLSVASPDAFGFGPSAKGAIRMLGSNEEPSPALELQPGKTFLVAAPELRVVGQHLYSPGGAVALFGTSPGSRVGLVNFDLSAGVPGAGVVSVSNPTGRNPLNMDGLAIGVLDTSASDGSGPIVVRAGRFELANGLVQSNTGSNEPAQGITIFASDSITLSGTAKIRTVGLGDGDSGEIELSAPLISLKGLAALATESQGTDLKGSSGRVKVSGNELVMSGESQINSITRALGSGGSIDIKTDRMRLQDHVRINSNAIAPPGSSAGNGGDISVTAPSLTMAGDATINSSSEGDADSKGSSGNVAIQSSQVAIGDRAVIFSNTSTRGKAGTVTLGTDSLRISEGGQIAALTSGAGHGGDLIVTAKDTAITGRGYDGLGAITASASSAGAAGKVRIRSGRLTLDNGLISTATTGSGNGGAIALEGAAMTLTGNAEVSTAAKGASNSPARGGNITVDAGVLQARDRALITSDTATSGDAGSVVITAKTLLLSDTASISARSSGTGNGGSVTINAPTVNITSNGPNGAGALSAVSSAKGNAGDVRLSADRLQLRGGSIKTASKTADGGNIDLRVTDTINADRSEVSTAVGKGQGAGGNINIDPRFVILRNSRILANAYGGPGGNIHVVAENFIADSATVINASSAQSVDGTVRIEAPQTNVNGAVALPSAAFLDLAQLLGRACAARRAGAGGSLALTHRAEGALGIGSAQFTTTTMAMAPHSAQAFDVALANAFNCSLAEAR